MLTAVEELQVTVDRGNKCETTRVQKGFCLVCVILDQAELEEEKETLAARAGLLGK